MNPGEEVFYERVSVSTLIQSDKRDETDDKRGKHGKTSLKRDVFFGKFGSKNEQNGRTRSRNEWNKPE
jgi:hypothetical protein